MPTHMERTPTNQSFHPSFAPGELFARLADLTGSFGKKCAAHLVSLIKVEGLFVSYIVSIFDIVNSETLV
jgi:hypothetical protein